MSSLSTGALLAYLARPKVAPPSATAAVDLAPYRDAAAVLAAIRHPDRLRPLGDGPAADARSILGAELIAATGRRFRGSVMLTPEARYRSIVGLRDRGELAAALAANPDEREGPVQAQLEAYLLGSAPPLEAQTLDELDATRQVAVWLRDAVPGIPAPDEVEARSAYLRLLAPFEVLAGDDVFQGRKRELDDLREYVGVVDPEALLKRLRARTLRWFARKAKPAFSLSGPGGVGKSALVARFMLEHTRVPEAARIPFAYLDFDRATLDVADPYGLAAEMIRQLVAQFPLARFEDLRTLVEARAAEPSAEAADRLAATESALGDILEAMGAELGPRPFLVVLDTFEEVQFRGEARAFALWEMLDRLQARWPFLRVVVSGRAPVTSLRLDDKPPRSLNLGDLDTDAAIGFLRKQGITDEALARRVVGSYGGVPLSLKLVGSLLASDAGALDGAGPDGAGADRGRVGDEVVQGQLYERVLSHIHDDRVRRLAHPGLVLRRITPEVIFEVLNAPCELGVASLEEAGALFAELEREVSLMTLDPDDGALVHRADVRRVMLRLLVANEPGRVERIRRGAVAYYDRLGGRRGGAEATYHRLHLGETVGEEVFKDPEVRASIQGAIVELPARMQVYLAGLGFQVAPEVLTEASLVEQERAMAALVEEFLPNGHAAEEEALRVLASTSPDIGHASPLFRASARVALQTGDAAKAATWIDRGLAEAGLANETALELDLLAERAWLEHVTAGAVTPETQGTLADGATRHGNARLSLLARLLAFAAGPRDEAAVRALGAAVGRATPDDIWALAPATRPFVEAGLRLRVEEAPAAVQRAVLEWSGPFRQAVLPDPDVQRRLEIALEPSADPVRFGTAFLEVLDAWPYRILSVAPPYGRRGQQLYESAS